MPYIGKSVDNTFFVAADDLTVTGNITVSGTVDGRDVAADGTKLDTVETNATADQTAAEIRALVESATDSNVFTDADHSKLNAIEAAADVTDAANVTAAGALMTTGGSVTGDVSFGDSNKAIFGAGSDLQIYHDGLHSYINEQGTGNLKIIGSDISIEGSGETHATFVDDGAVTLYHDNAAKLATASFGAQVTGSLAVDTITNASSSTDVTIDTNFDIILDAGSSVTTKCTAGAGNYALGAYNPTSTSSRAIALFQSNVGGTQENKVVIQCDGAVGIGTASPTKKVSASIGLNDTDGYVLEYSGDAKAGMLVVPATGEVRMGAINSSGTYFPTFYSNNSEAARIDSTGGLRVGTNSNVLNSAAYEQATIKNPGQGNALTLQSTNVSGGFPILYLSSTDSTASQNAVVFQRSGSGVGTITTSSSGTTAYNTSSDYRLKTEVNYDWDATTRLKQLKPARFKWIVDGDDAVQVDGFLAHEAQAVVPEAVTGTKDETRDVENVILSSEGVILYRGIAEADWTAGKLATTDDDGNTVDAVYPSDSTWAASHTEDVMQGIDQAKLVPLLCKTILELEARITAQQSTITALTARIETLEAN